MNKNNVAIKFLVIILMSIPTLVSAQDTLKNIPKIDVSPMDASYYPANFPILKIRDKVTTPLAVKLVYSRPQLKGRAMFGELLPYAQVWRMGANEASEIEFFQDVTIGGKKIKKGEYSLYAIPEATEWTIIVNTENDVWGSFKYDESKDIVRVKVPVAAIANTVESFTVFFDETKDGCNLIAAWDKVMVKLPIQF
jgi:hypothetical protein